jgi:signal transduction histidine kinase
VTRLLHASPLRLALLAALGALAALIVAVVTAHNPQAGPTHGAVVIRVSIIVTLIAAGLYAQTSRLQTRMGSLLVTVGFVSSLWLLNGSGRPLAFGVGMATAGVMPLLFAYLLLAHPRGALHTAAERRLLILGGALHLGAWTALLLSSRQPGTESPLVRCTPHCPSNPFFVHTTSAAVEDLLESLVVIGWATLAVGVAVLLIRQARAASPLARRALIPVAGVAIACVLCLVSYVAVRAAGNGAQETLGALCIGVAVGVPLAILVGLAWERMGMGRALADFVTALTRMPDGDPQALMAAALDDPTLEIAYHRPAPGRYVDAAGAAVTLPLGDPERAVTWVRRGHRPVAAVVFDARLANEVTFVQAAGGAATMRLERAQLEAELRASAIELAASRIRLVEAADAERQRIERDLHDGIQQHLLGLRIKLDLAAESLNDEPELGKQLIASIGRQMDDLLGQVRSLARGIYPAVLSGRGVGEALKSAARLAPGPVSVRTHGVGRYPEDVEVAVYFSCLEALQNVAKHAGPNAPAVVSLREEGGWLWFEVRDFGAGFDPGAVEAQHGLINIHDRIDAVGGSVAVSSPRGLGTRVAGRVPVSPPSPAASPNPVTLS